MLKPKQQKNTFNPFDRHTIEINNQRESPGYIEQQIIDAIRRADWPESGRHIKLSVTIAELSPNGEGVRPERFGWERFAPPNGMEASPRTKRALAIAEAIKRAQRQSIAHVWFIVGSNNKMQEYISMGPIATAKDNRKPLLPKLAVGPNP